MEDVLVDRCIGLAALVVGGSVIFFAIRLPGGTTLALVRKIIGGVVATVLILYGIYALIVG